MNNHRLSSIGRKVIQIFHLLVLLALVGLPTSFLGNIRKHPNDPTRIGIDVAGYILLYIVIILYGRYAYQRCDQHPKKRSGTLKWVVGGYLAIIVGNMAFSMLNNLFYHQSTTANNTVLNSLMHSNRIVMVVLAIGAFTLTPIAEELIFRGVLMNTFFAKDSFWPKVILSGLVFSLEHLSTTPISFLIYVYLGGVLAYVYRRSGKLQNSILLHALNNFISIMVLLR